MRISGPKRDKIIGNWRKLHNEELHKSYYTPNIIRMLKPRMMKLAGHVARMGTSEIFIGFWWENQKRRGH
jgi:hypothetical protein